MCEGGAERAGLYYTCVNSYLSVEEVAYIVNDSQTRVVVTNAAKAEVACQLPALCPNVERWLVAGAAGAAARSRTGRRPSPAYPPRPDRRRAARHPDAVLIRARPAARRGSCARCPR